MLRAHGSHGRSPCCVARPWNCRGASTIICQYRHNNFPGVGMSRSGLFSTLIIATLCATSARAQDAARPPVGGVASPQDAMIFYAVHGGEEACGANCTDWIAAEGAIEWDTFKRLFAFLDRFGQRRRPVVLNIAG